MSRLVSTLEVRQKLGDMLNHVALRHDEYIIMRKGKPLAAMVPVERLEQMRRAARLHLLDALAKSANSDITPEQADVLANEAKHSTRIKTTSR